MWDKRAYSLISCAFAALVGTGCGAGDPAASDDAADTAACGSALGDAVLAAARSGPTTVPAGLEWRRSRYVGEPRVGGASIADAIDEVLTQAEREVLIAFYEIDERSWLAGRLKAALQKLPSSVQVRILVQPSNGRGLLGVLSESTSAARDRLTKFFDLPNVTVGAWQNVGLLGVMHTKAIVVDGARALVSDANIQPNADPVDQKGGLGWFQVAMVLEGDVAFALRSEMASAWAHADGPRDVAASPAARPVSACTRMIPLGRDAGAKEEASADQAYARLFRAAVDEVHAVTPNLNDDGARQALADATEDAHVFLILSKGFNDFTESLPGQGGTNASNVTKLSQMAKDRCKLHVRWFAQDDGTTIDGNGTGASHSKWATADGKVTIHGSQNLDTQSWKGSRELSVAVDDAETTGKYDRLFRQVWDRSSVAFEPDGCP